MPFASGTLPTPYQYSCLVKFYCELRTLPRPSRARVVQNEAISERCMVVRTVTNDAHIGALYLVVYTAVAGEPHVYRTTTVCQQFELKRRVLDCPRLLEIAYSCGRASVGQTQPQNGGCKFHRTHKHTVQVSYCCVEYRLEQKHYYPNSYLQLADFRQVECV